MKAEVLIKEVRESNQKLWDSYQLFLSTNGEQGINCFTPDKMKRLLERTDKEIIEAGIAKGVVIEDADIYLNT
jgi:hypothetical protein